MPLMIVGHGDYIPNARFVCYGYYIMIFGHEISAIILLIVTVNMENHILGLIARGFVFQISIVSKWISFLLVSDESFVV